MTNIRPAWERNATFDIYRRNLVQLCKYSFAKRVLPFAKLFDMEVHVRLDITNTFCKMSCPFMFKIQRTQRFTLFLFTYGREVISITFLFFHHCL